MPEIQGSSRVFNELNVLLQTTVLRHLLSHLLQAEEDWEGAARALMQIPLEGGSR